VFPLLAEHWPTVPAKYSRAVRTAFVLAEQSAAEGRAVDGLAEAAANAVIAAGAALWTRFEDVGSRPENAHLGTIASFVAKVAEKAAEAARARGEESLTAAMQAWSFATQVAGSADELGIAEGLAEDFVKLYRMAAQDHWTNRTKVPSEIWMEL
jgi:hypothetical protein